MFALVEEAEEAIADAGIDIPTTFEVGNIFLPLGPDEPGVVEEEGLSKEAHDFLTGGTGAAAAMVLEVEASPAVVADVAAAAVVEGPATTAVIAASREASTAVAVSGSAICDTLPSTSVVTVVVITATTIGDLGAEEPASTIPLAVESIWCFTPTPDIEIEVVELTGDPGTVGASVRSVKSVKPSVMDAAEDGTVDVSPLLSAVVVAAVVVNCGGGVGGGPPPSSSTGAEIEDSITGD